MDILLIVAGLALLYYGGEWLIRGSVTIAAKLKLSQLLVSTVIVGFGTSTPELMVSIEAALKGSPDIALGNIVGSNISNALLILGIAATLAFIPCHTAQIRRDAIMGGVAAAFLALLSFADIINRFAGLALLSILAAYLSYTIWHEKQAGRKEKEAQKELGEHIQEDMAEKSLSLPKAIGLTTVSLFLLMGGANVLVRGAVSIAGQFGVSEALIGLTLVAVGTSLPELATTVVAAWRKHTDVVIGNILGSNLFNILAILGVTALIKPIPFTGQIAEQDVWIMLAVSALLLPLMLSGKGIGRKEGIGMLALYAGYIGWLFVSG